MNSLHTIELIANLDNELAHRYCNPAEPTGIICPLLRAIVNDRETIITAHIALRTSFTATCIKECVCGQLWRLLGDAIAAGCVSDDNFCEAYEALYGEAYDGTGGWADRAATGCHRLTMLYCDRMSQYDLARSLSCLMTNRAAVELIGLIMATRADIPPGFIFQNIRPSVLATAHDDLTTMGVI